MRIRASPPVAPIIHSTIVCCASSNAQAAKSGEREMGAERERGSNRFPGKEMRSSACYMHTHSESTYRAVTCNIEWRKPSRPKRGGLFTWKVWAGVLHLLVGKGKQRPTRPSNQRGAIPAFHIFPSPFAGMVSSCALIPEWIGCPHHNGY